MSLSYAITGASTSEKRCEKSVIGDTSSDGKGKTNGIEGWARAATERRRGVVVAAAG
jgi:hypothetical protein